MDVGPSTQDKSLHKDLAQHLKITDQSDWVSKYWKVCLLMPPLHTFVKNRIIRSMICSVPAIEQVKKFWL